MDVGQLLVQARTRARLTRRQLATAAGTSLSAVAAYETGKKSPAVATFDRLLAACGLQLASVLEPLMAHVDARLDAMLACAPDLDEDGMLRLAATFDDDPDAPWYGVGQRPGRDGPVTWAFDGATALGLHGLRLKDAGVAVAVVLDSALRWWLWANRLPAVVSWWEAELEEVQGALRPGLLTPWGALTVRVVAQLPATVRMVLGEQSRVVPVLTVDAVERAHPQHAELLRRWRERDVA